MKRFPVSSRVTLVRSGDQECAAALEAVNAANAT